MKTAVLISGQLRTFKKCYPTQRWQIFRHYEPDIHFFFAVCDDEQADDWSIIAKDYEHVHFCKLKDPELPEIPSERGVHAPYANAASHKKLLLQHLNNQRVWEFCCDSDEEFDCIIRIRPDLWIHRFQPLRKPEPQECFCPWWGKFGGVNDRLAVMGIAAASAYFMTYSSIPNAMKAGCPFHPETLVAANLRHFSIDVRPLMTEFSTERMDGSRRWAEIVMSDIAELVATK